MSLEPLPLQPDPSKNLPKSPTIPQPISDEQLKSTKEKAEAGARSIESLTEDEEKDALEKDNELQETRIENQELQSGHPSIVWVKNHSTSLAIGGGGLALALIAKSCL